MGFSIELRSWVSPPEPGHIGPNLIRMTYKVIQFNDDFEILYAGAT